MNKRAASICFFNNKGGVGKTTLACNIGAYLAQHHQLRVLLVDADPQCNATQLVLPEELTMEVYRDRRHDISSLKDILAPLTAGDASVQGPVRPASKETNRFHMSVIPGHPQVALLEDTLSQNWTNFIGSNVGGARITNWNTQLLALVEEDFDLVLFDVGPSLGALNRSVLVGVDYFVSPMGCDIFSLIGIENIADWLTRWHKKYDDAFARFEAESPGALTAYPTRHASRTMSRFLGYTVQQYITKTIRSERRATTAYEAILAQIPSQVSESLSPLLPVPSPVELHLGDVPHMFSLVPLAQTAHTPIHGLTGRDGLSGGQYAQQRDYQDFIAALAKALLRNLQAVTGNG